MASRQLTVLPASSAGLDSDLYHTRQGATDKSLTGVLVKDFTKWTNQDFYSVLGINAYSGTAATETAVPAAYFDGQEVHGIFNTNTLASTINVGGLGIKNIKIKGVDPVAGEISGRTILIYDLANNWFELHRSGFVLRSDLSSTFTGDTLTFDNTSKVRLENLFDATASSTNHAFQVGLDSGINIGIGNGEIQQRSNGVVSALRLNPAGADVHINGANKVWHQGNDGAGSGLDADTVDGIQGANFLRSDVADTTTGNLTISNTAPTFILSDTDNVSETLGAVLLNSGGTTFLQSNNQGQMKFTARNDAALSLFQMRDAVGLQDIFHTGNDGAGSGLDADTVDGIQAAQFLRSDVADTSAGTITLDSGLSDTPEIKFNDPVNNTNGQMDVAGEAFRVLTQYRGGVVQVPFKIGAQLGVAEFLNGPTVGGSTIWYAGNDGAGSGLDADLLDGIQGASLLRSDVSDTFTGDTLTLDTAAKLRLDNTTDASSVSTNHAFQIGSTTGLNLIADNNEIMARSNGATATLNLNPEAGSVTINGNTAFHAGNDGAGSGLDADLLDGLQGASYLRSDASDVYSGGKLSIDLPAALGSSTGSVNTLEIRQQAASNDAFLTFIVSGDFAGHMGLDFATNDLFIGGFSYGAVKHKIFHAGNSDGVTTWVNFDTTTSTVLTDSRNVSSVTDNGVGNTTVNFGTALANTTYGWAGGAQDTDLAGDATVARPSGGVKSTTAMKIVTANASAGTQDFPQVSAIFFGG